VKRPYFQVFVGASFSKPQFGHLLT